MPNRNTLMLASLLLAVATAACQDREPEPEPIASMPEAFPVMFVPPEGRLVASGGTRDALQLVFTSPMPHDPTLAYYRLRLGTAPWVIVSDTREGDITTVYAENAGQPLWVRVSPTEDGGSRIELNGAVLSDTGKTGATPPAGRRPADSIQPDTSGRL